MTSFFSRTSIIPFCAVVDVSFLANTGTLNGMNDASTIGSFIIAQTTGMERRGERRNTRKDCRQQ